MNNNNDSNNNSFDYYKSLSKIIKFAYIGVPTLQPTLTNSQHLFRIFL